MSNRQFVSVMFSLSMLAIAPNSFADDSPKALSPSAPVKSARQVAGVSPRRFSPLHASVFRKQEKSRTRWYGSEIIVSTLAFDALTVAGFVAHHKDLKVGPYMIAGGLAGRVIIPSVIHLAHGNGAGAWGSLALQTLGPVATGAIGLGVGYGLNRAGVINLGGDHVGSGFILVTLVSAGAGAIAATAIDAAVLAKEPVRPWRRARTGSAESWNMALVPTLDPKRAGLSLIGQF